MKNLFYLPFLLVSIFLFQCDKGVKKDYKALDVQELTKNQPEVHGSEIKEGDVTLSNPLNQDWIKAGESIYELKCLACHKLTDEKLVGPGWKGVTKTRKPIWIMNMITNVEMMLESDPEAQKLLEQCLVRMPNQNVSKEESRSLLEFMRKNDGEQ
ncbi:MAG: c-type cytochrome [Saprospiraceae bacterium]|nr:c-type cytochrome [Saprospiraceae bacterium]